MDLKLSCGEESSGCRLSGKDKKHHKQKGGTIKSVGKEKDFDS